MLGAWLFTVKIRECKLHHVDPARSRARQNKAVCTAQKDFSPQRICFLGSCRSSLPTTPGHHEVFRQVRTRGTDYDGSGACIYRARASEPRACSDLYL